MPCLPAVGLGLGIMKPPMVFFLGALLGGSSQLVFMVQKSDEKTTWDGAKTLVNHENNYLLLISTPVDMLNIPLFIGFSTIPGGLKTLDVFHQQPTAHLSTCRTFAFATSSGAGQGRSLVELQHLKIGLPNSCSNHPCFRGVCC